MLAVSLFHDSPCDTAGTLVNVRVCVGLSELLFIARTFLQSLPPSPLARSMPGFCDRIAVSLLGDLPYRGSAPRVRTSTSFSLGT